MRNKVFYQTNILWQLFCFIFLAVFIACVIVGVQFIIGIVNNGLGQSDIDRVVSIILLVVYFTATLLILWLFIRFEHNNLHFTNEKMYMNDDWNNRKNKIYIFEDSGT